MAKFRGAGGNWDSIWPENICDTGRSAVRNGQVLREPALNAGWRDAGPPPADGGPTSSQPQRKTSVVLQAQCCKMYDLLKLQELLRGSERHLEDAHACQGMSKCTTCRNELLCRTVCHCIVVQSVT